MISEELKITIVQSDIIWENKKENFKNYSSLLDEQELDTDLIILPEMFSTGFSMNTKLLAENESGESLSWMKSKAQEMDCVITGSIITRDNGQHFNRLYWVNPDGSFHYYDKRHLFSFAGEQDHYTAGTSRLIVTLKGWRICPLICYDLRFPEWSRNIDFENQDADNAYDLLLFVANWPEARRKPWINLLEARAHENQAYVAGVNRIGKDGNQNSYSGDSFVFSPKGEVLSSIENHKEGAQTVTLSFKDLEKFREKFTAWKDKDNFEIKV